MITAPDIDDPCNDPNRDRHVRDFKQYPPTDDGTIVYRMSAGPWGRIEQRAGGEWCLTDSDGRLRFAYGIGPSARAAVLDYIDQNHRCGLEGGRATRLCDATTPQELYSRARIRADQIVNILNSIGSAPTPKHDDFRACPPEIMSAVIGLTCELLDAWEQSVDPKGGDLFWVGQVRARVAPRIAALEERWADRRLPRF